MKLLCLKSLTVVYVLHTFRVFKQKVGSLPLRLRFTALVVSCVLMLNMIDTIILGIALPVISKDFGSSPVTLSLTLSIYLIAQAIFTPISGWAADKFGSKTVFLLATGGFLIASLLCGLSNSATQLILARLFQGVTAALTLPVARIVLLKSSPKEMLVQAMVWLTGPALVGPLVAPPLGGFLVTYASWRWIFWINIPISLIGFVLAIFFFQNFKRDDTPSFDWSGFWLIGLGSLGFTTGLIAVTDTSKHNYLFAGVIVLSLILFFTYFNHAKRTDNPIIDLTLFRNASFRASVTGGAIFRIGIGAGPFLLPMMLQDVLGKSAFAASMLLLLLAVGALAIGKFIPMILRYLGFRGALIPNTLLVSLSFCSYGFFYPSTPLWIICAILLLGGVVRSIQFNVLNTIGFTELTESQMSPANSLASMSQFLARTLGVSIGAFMIQISLNFNGRAHLTQLDFTIAFVVIGAIMLLALVEFYRLPPHAGSEASGHNR
ncbi:MFS transporter [Flexibacterium corallicola]|uniref:MFS transporter n=1 Tax=Flexibacterium corallicola TaxID=3037259 RepID=UPI00286FA921|nr:MFS transporter [Pseudovibrio sp. M1P-2-3]